MSDGLCPECLEPFGVVLLGGDGIRCNDCCEADVTPADTDPEHEFA